jgi:chaperonin GroEL
MSKKILFNKEARLGVQRGIDIVANAIRVTMGAGGRVVIISDGNNPTRTTKDGITVANHIDLKDEIENAGAKMAKEISSKVSDIAGDGTSGVVILFQELVKHGLSLIESGASPQKVKFGMELAVKSILLSLDEMAIPVGEGTEVLKQVAAVSANNDKEIGDIVGEVFSKLGKYGIIAIEDSKGQDTWIDRINGFQFDCGWFNEYYINDFAKNICELENPYMLIVEGKITKFGEVKNIIEQAVRVQRPIVIIAEDFDYAMTRDFLHNIHQLKVVKGCCIKYNYTGETKQELMQDLCAMTGATLISENTGKKMENIQIADLGECEKIVCTKTETTLVSGKQNQELVNSRIEDARNKIENAKHPLLKQLYERRMAKLSGGIAICYVGGSTEVERSEKKDRVDDSVRATKAAIEEGIVVGGGTALLRCIDNLTAINLHDEDVIKGVRLVKKCIEKPAFQIAENAFGTEAYLKLEKVKEAKGNIGFNAKTGNIEDLVSSGIIDPKKVVRVCIENAVSAAAQVLISEALIVNDN